MKVAVVSLYWANYQPLADIVLPNWREYCDRHGYALHVHKGEYGPHAIGFQKMRWLYDLLFGPEAVDLALVIDLDVLFTNLTLPFETFAATDPAGHHAYWVTEDTHGLNNGSFIIRRSEGAREILDHMIRHAGVISNEQDTIKYHLPQLPFRHHVKLIGHPSINSLLYRLYPEYPYPETIPGDWRRGDLLLHLPGCSLEKRLSVFGAREIRDAIVR